MKNSAQKIYQRHQYIERLLQEATESKLSVHDLANLCQVSLMTIRRDLSTLETMGIVTRFHGFVRLNNNYKFNDTVFINTSSTALYTLTALFNKPVNIITNNLRIHEQILLHEHHIVKNRMQNC